MGSGEPSATLVRTHDAEIINDLYRTARIDWVQLQSGPFEGSLAILDLGALRVLREEFNLGWRRNGELRPGTALISMSTAEQMHALWFGREVAYGDLGVTSSGVDVSAAGAGSGYSVMFDTAKFRERFPPAGDGSNLVDLCHVSRLQYTPVYAGRIRSFIRGLFSMIEVAPQAIMRPSMGRLIERDLMPLLASALDGNPAEGRSYQSRRVEAVRACEAHMAEHIDDIITLQDLSDATGMRPRSVANAFEAVTGLTPMSYLKAKRLSGVRRALQRPERKKLRIIDVAADWGFWHMGHFTAAYRLMYGETPSQTLQR
jgi:AraC family ethanolamine operon transcriptional activator